MSALDEHVSHLPQPISLGCESEEHRDCDGRAVYTLCGSEIGETECGCECHKEEQTK